MRKINMGNSGLTASVIAIGCMRISDMSLPDVAALADKALELGINLFDHADIYGGGESERLFGRLFAEKPSLRESMILQSKCGIKDGLYDLSKAHILHSVDGILERLCTDYLDVLMLHRPDALMEPEEIAEAFDILHEAGKVRHFGVSNMNPAQIDMLSGYVGQKLIVNQLQFSIARTGMIDSGINVNVPNETGSSRDAGVLEYCRAKQITIQAWSPLQYGFFDGVFLGSDRYPALNTVLDRISEELDVTPSAVAIAWILRHPANMQAITGSTNITRIAEMAQAGKITLSREQWYEIYRAAGNKLP